MKRDEGMKMNHGSIDTSLVFFRAGNVGSGVAVNGGGAKASVDILDEDDAVRNVPYDFILVS